MTIAGIIDVTPHKNNFGEVYRTSNSIYVKNKNN
jgi:hypothetical protein